MDQGNNFVRSCVGLANMTDDEIDTEYFFWCDGGIDAEIDENALAHEAATNNT